ncbi:YbaB/EbfC family nucleoid-associated protein [Glycomyces buryatensis]|nr:YbaB/EbfC family nucleoid-associated protein [Glycomyces buryatensis]
MRTPEEIMQSLESRVAQIQERASRAEEQLAAASTSLSSDDETVTVTVNAGGALTGLRFSPQARGMSGAGLAELTLETYQRAAAEAGRKTTEIMGGLVGGDSEAMGMLQSFTDPRQES